jgi:DNA-binding IclR family transcriptional regulator
MPSVPGLVKSTILRLALSLQRYRLIARLPDGSYRHDAETFATDREALGSLLATKGKLMALVGR